MASTVGWCASVSTVWIVALFMVNTMVMPLLVELVKEHAPSLARRLIRVAARMLPGTHRERYLAEWMAELDEMERQNVSQLLASIRILVSAPTTGSVLRAMDRPASRARWWERLVDRTEQIARRLASGPSRRYREFLLSMLRFSHEQGVLTSGFYRPELDEIFVDVTLAHASQRVPAELLPALAGSSDRWGIEHYLDRRQPVVLAVIGAAGTGKTTLLRHTARQICTTRRGRRRTVPVLLTLRDHVADITATQSVALSEVLNHSLRRFGSIQPAKWFERRLRAGNCVVLLDGLDEVTRPSDRRIVADWIERQVEQYPRNDFVITSRPHGYLAARLNQATVLQVRSFTDEQVFKFIQLWYLAMERRATEDDGMGAREETESAANDLQERLTNAPELFELTVNPLLLNIIANVHRYRGALPGSRVALYGEICQVMLWRRQESKKLATGLRGDMKEALLRHLAFTMMQRGTSGLPRADVVADLEPVLHRLSPSASVNEFLVDAGTCGLLVERENGVYAFAHLVFQEYMAASHVQDTGLTDVLANNVDDPWWQETIRLYVSLVDDADKIVQACLASGTDTAISLAFACAGEDVALDPELCDHLGQLIPRQAPTDSSETNPDPPLD